MDKFKTMPLRLRVWDKEDERFLPPDKVAIMNGKLYFLENWVATNTTSYIFSELDEDKLIVSQDTGLKDMNERSIFSGDIVADMIGPELNCGYGVVYYDIAQATWRIRWLIFANQLHDPSWEDKEVIGNIWQNPKLLEEND